MSESSSLKQGYSATSYAFYSSRANTLTSLLTTLPEANDKDLTKFIENRLSRGSVLGGSGQITTIDLGIEPAHCYFCLLNPTDAVGAEDDQYMVCFVTECNRGLDSFRAQLDQYAQTVESAIKNNRSSDLIELVKPFLDNWYRECLLFIVNCVKVFGKDIKYIIYNAVTNGHINVDTDDKYFEGDVERFHASCALTALLSHAADSVDSSESSCSLIDLNEEPQCKMKRAVDILSVTHRDNEITFSHRLCTEFCERWAQSLLEKFAYSTTEGGDVNPFSLKSINENYKLKTIQDMNTLKRLVKEAELDFYALYRSHIFIGNSGNSKVLLMHAMNEEQNADSLSILKLLEEKSSA